ncbi:AfsR/SARP family transcriptional regulator [Lachnobacterium bovis]|uniref:AfsR/SARP family transcriptional regulator n=1 Tax=Lachnobacterium bovis TaxID=140626 RepID=UPI00048993CB|nr:BTAD domain-containing putative transcriptional regulator [Lachnobacterium bovis]
MLKIHTLGKFQLQYNDKVVEMKEIRSAMMTKVLLYLLIYRDEELNSERLCMAIWERSDVANPAGALKNLIYRLRNFFRNEFGIEDVILNSCGSYKWNPQVDVELDVEKFKEIIKTAKNQEKEKAILLYREGLDIYKGDFMPAFLDLYWILTLNTYYHSLYLSAAKRLAEIYSTDNNMTDLEKLCNVAIKIDNTEEEIYCYLIEALVKLDHVSMAYETYDKAKKILFNELKIDKTEKLDEAYKMILSFSKSDVVDEMDEVYEDINEMDEDVKGAFVCGYQVFKEIYRMNARLNARDDEEGQVLLITLDSCYKQKNDMTEYQIKRAMASLEKILIDSLRIGDVISKYSTSQYIVLLQSCNEENGIMVSNRIVEKLLEKNKKNRSVSVQIDLEPVELASRADRLFQN